MFMGNKIFLKCALKLLNRHYKTQFSTDHHAKFHADRPTHLRDLASKEKNISSKTEVLPKTLSENYRFRED